MRVSSSPLACGLPEGSGHVLFLTPGAQREGALRGMTNEQMNERVSEVTCPRSHAQLMGHPVPLMPSAPSTLTELHSSRPPRARTPRAPEGQRSPGGASLALLFRVPLTPGA